MTTLTQKSFAQKALDMKKKTIAVSAGVSVFALTALTAVAGTDTTFSALSNMLDGWLVGSLGVVLARGGVLYAAFSLFRGQSGGAAVGLGVAAICAFGPAIVTGMFTAVI